MKWKGRQLQVSLSCCSELDPFLSSAEFPTLSQTRKHFRYFVLIHLWCLGFGTSVVYFGHKPRWKCAGKGVHLAGEGLAALFWPAPTPSDLGQFKSKIFRGFPSHFWILRCLKMHKGHLWRAQALNIWKFTGLVSACLPGWIFCYFGGVFVF